MIGTEIYGHLASVSIRSVIKCATLCNEIDAFLIVDGRS
jgi:hypothetical protein